MQKPRITAPVRVLLVEDEYFIADDLRRELEECGAGIVGPTSSVHGAFDILNRGTPFDAAVLDVSLQDEDVWPFARALRDRFIPFVFATGYDNAVVPPDLCGAPLFRKPVDVPALAAAVFAQARPGVSVG